MIEIIIPKDIRKYDSKLIGPFNLRQCICAASMAVLCFLSYKPIVELFDQSMAINICMIIAAPFIVIGWVPIQGMPAEQFIKSTFTGMFLAPKHRLYKVKNIYTEDRKFIPMNLKSYKARIKKDKKLAKNNIDYEMIK